MIADCECSSFDDVLAASVRALGYDSAREHQREAIRELLAAKMCLYVYLRATENSSAMQYCHCLRGKDSSILCVSPLVSLMVDQEATSHSRVCDLWCDVAH